MSTQKTRKKEVEVSPKQHRKVEMTVRLSPEEKRVVEMLANQNDLPVAEVLRQAVTTGLPKLVEDANRIKIWQKVSQKTAIIDALDKIPQERLGEALDLLSRLAEPKEG